MPFTVFSDPPLEHNLPMSENPFKMQTPLQPVLGPIQPHLSPAAGSMKRSPLGEKCVPGPSPQRKDNVVSLEEEVNPHFLTATVDVGVIDSVMASRLVTCVLGFVLFLKNQIPFPITQLIRMHSAKSDDVPNRRLDSLITSMDILSSHPTSTFTALTMAFSQAKSHINRKADMMKSHIVIILGPSPTSVSAALACVVLEVHGLRAPWVPASETAEYRTGVISNEGLKENTYAGVTSGCYEPARERRRLREVSQLVPLADVSETEDGERSSVDGGSPPTSDIESDSEGPEFDSDEEGESSEGDESSVTCENTEAVITSAERVLLRTLTIANSNPDLGLAADIRPTFTHLFIRAPRRFTHPSWIPRQGVSRDMDPLLCQQEEEEFEETSTTSKTGAKGRGLAGVKTDYIRVQSLGTVDSGSSEAGESNRRVLDDRDEDESEDEMIWWSWDGTLEGFTEI